MHHWPGLKNIIVSRVEIQDLLDLQASVKLADDLKCIELKEKKT